MRLDLHLVETGAYASRARARAAIEAGCVRVNGVAAKKPSQSVGEGDDVVAEGDALHVCGTNDAVNRYQELFGTPRPPDGQRSAS